MVTQAKAVAMTDDVPELIGELRKRTALIQNLEARIVGEFRLATGGGFRRGNPPDQSATPTGSAAIGTRTIPFVLLADRPSRRPAQYPSRT